MKDKINYLIAEKLLSAYEILLQAENIQKTKLTSHVVETCGQAIVKLLDKEYAKELIDKANRGYSNTRPIKVDRMGGRE